MIEFNMKVEITCVLQEAGDLLQILTEVFNVTVVVKGGYFLLRVS